METSGKGREMGRREAMAGIGAIFGAAVLGGCEDGKESTKGSADGVDKETGMPETPDSTVPEIKHEIEPIAETSKRENAAAEQMPVDDIPEPPEQSVGKAEVVEENIEKAEIAELLKNIDYRNIEMLEKEKIGHMMGRLRELVDQQKLTREKIIEAVFPPNDYAVNFFYSDKHTKELQQEAKKLPGEATPYNERVRTVANQAPTARKWCSRHLQVFSEYARHFGEHVSWDKSAYLLDDPEAGKLPSGFSLRFAHQDAFDIFYPVKNDGDREIGPQLRSMTPGVVVAAEGDWRGGKEKELYGGGGLSPKSGNAVLVYNPRTNEFFYNAHLDTVSVKRGDIVSAGDPIGIGGNTGFKARRKGRGRHTHFEIHKFDPAKNAGSSVSIYDLAKRVEKVRQEARDARRVAGVDTKK